MNQLTLLRGVLAAAALAVLLAGAPAVLIAIGGNPIAGMGSAFAGGADWWNRPFGVAEFDAVLLGIGWFLWAQFLYCVVVEALAWLRSDVPRVVRLAGASQSLARTLVISALLLVGAFSRTPAPTHVEAVPAVAVSVSPTNTAAQVQSNAHTEADSHTQVKRAITVKPRDDLWSLAEAHLGDPLRWREIYQLNEGRPQSDGRGLRQPDLIRPGWVLLMPADATGVNKADVAPSPPPVKSVVIEPSTPVTEVAPFTEPGAFVDEATNEVPATDGSETPEGSELSTRILASGLTAVGLVGLLARLRRRQQRQRRLGQVVAQPSEQLRHTESALRFAAEMSAAERLDAAVRALAFHLAESGNTRPPRLDGVRVGVDGVEFLFADRLSMVEGPFRSAAEGRTLLLPAEVESVRVGPFAQLMPALYPALLTVGKVDDADVLVDVEAARWTGIVGDKDVVTDFFAAAVTELCTNVWSDYSEVIVIGDVVHASYERLREFPFLQDALTHLQQAASTGDSLGGSGLDSVVEGRLQAHGDAWPPVVVVVAEALDSTEERALSECIGNRAGQGIAVLSAGDCQSADRRIHLTADTAVVNPPDLRVQRTGLTRDDVQSIEQLLDEVTKPPVEAPIAHAIDLRTPAKASSHEVVIRVLGPVVIDGGVETIDRPRSVELAVYLALHADGVTDDRLKSALWPDKRVSPGSFHSTMSRARSKLGLASDGTPHLPPISNGLYRLSCSVGADVDLFRQILAQAADASGSAKLDLMCDALALVRGAPFAETRGYQWAYNEGIVGSLESMVADAAYTAADQAFQASEYDRGHWAARQGLLASPGWEPIYRLRMEAFDKQGNPAGVRSVIYELVEVLEADDPYMSLHPETVALWQLLDAQARRTTPAPAK